MKKALVAFILLFSVVVGVAIGGYLWWASAVKAPSSSQVEKDVLIKKGSSAEAIGNVLRDAGVIKSAFAFKLYTQLTNTTKNIPPGQFSVPMNLSLEDLVALLKKGPKELWVTIPEGYRREEIADKFVDSLMLTGDAADTFRSEFLSLSRGKEGYLFPDTYLFPPETTAEKVVVRLQDVFDQKVNTGLAAELKNSKLSLHDAVILASIIERETLSDEERPIVAGILLNRLNAGWPLQADATVQYFLGTKRCEGKVNCDWWQIPLKGDLELASPYNTYTNTGLPPAPISNPGLVSLKAALDSTDSQYWYYIHDKDGNIHYAKTLEEHNANVAKYLR